MNYTKLNKNDYTKWFNIRSLSIGELSFQKSDRHYPLKDLLYIIIWHYLPVASLFFLISGGHWSYWLLCIPFFVFIATGFHELGHYWVGRLMGLDIRYYHLSTFLGGMVYFPADNVLSFYYLSHSNGFRYGSNSVLLAGDTEKIADSDLRRAMTYSLLSGPLVNLSVGLGFLFLWLGISEYFILLFALVNLFTFVDSLSFTDGPDAYKIWKNGWD